MRERRDRKSDRERERGSKRLTPTQVLGACRLNTQLSMLYFIFAQNATKQRQREKKRNKDGVERAQRSCSVDAAVAG